MFGSCAFAPQSGERQDIRSGGIGQAAFLVGVGKFGFLLRLPGFKFGKNLYSLYINYQIFTGFILCIFLFSFLLCFRPWKELVQDQLLIFPLVTVLIFPLGYLMLLVEERYLFLNWVLLLAMAGNLLTRLFVNPFFTRHRKMLVSYFVFGSFVVFPLKNLLKERYSYRSFYAVANALVSHCGISGNIASNSHYASSLVLSLHLKGHYFGVPRPAATATELEKDIFDFGIDHFVVWDPAREKAKFPFLAKFREIPIGLLEDFPAELSIFSIHESAQRAYPENCVQQFHEK